MMCPKDSEELSLKSIFPGDALSIGRAFWNRCSFQLRMRFSIRHALRSVGVRLIKQEAVTKTNVYNRHPPTLSFSIISKRKCPARIGGAFIEGTRVRRTAAHSAVTEPSIEIYDFGSLMRTPATR